MFHLGEFQFRVATTASQIEAAQRLRYQVYVEEYGFEKPEDHPGGLEKDAYDPSSIHFVATDVHGRVVGASRLIQNSPLGLPALKIAGSHYQDKNPQSRKIVEVSRLALAKSLRGKTQDNFQDMDFYLGKICQGRLPQEDKGVERRVIVVLGLIQLMAQVGEAMGVSDYFIVSEKRLVVLLKRHGVIYRQIGAEVDHHGLRAPFMAHAREIHPVIFHFRNKLSRALGGSHEPVLPSGRGITVGGFDFNLATGRQEQAEAAALAADQPLALASSGSDIHDLRALHVLAKDKAGRPVATVRLLPNSSLGLPAMEMARADYQNNSHKVAEVSRLALANLAGVASPRRQAMVLLGLFHMVYQLATSMRITGLYMIIEDEWAAKLIRHGLPLRAVGRTIGHNPSPWLLKLDVPQLVDFRFARAMAKTVAQQSKQSEPTGV